MLEKFSKLPMSKKLTIVLSWAFFISFAFTIASFLIWDKDITFIFQYMFYVYNICIISYFGKSGFENVSPNFKETFKDRQDNITQG